MKLKDWIKEISEGKHITIGEFILPLHDYRTGQRMNICFKDDVHVEVYQHSPLSTPVLRVITRKQAYFCKEDIHIVLNRIFEQVTGKFNHAKEKINA